ncbi:hypothetical protein C6P78_14575 [Burkholderia multivorans]|nr:hypothetical protein C6P78_14575 [Burkholderia multivorans]
MPLRRRRCRALPPPRGFPAGARGSSRPPSIFKDCYTFAQFRQPAGNLCLSASIVRLSRTHLPP